MKRFFAGMTAGLLAVILIFSVQGLSAQNALLLDGDTGRVLYEKNADKRGLIASTTKIMTALIVCEQSNVLDRVRIPQEAVGIEGSSMYLEVGEVLTVQDLLYGLMLRSGNDAAVALAVYCAGTVEGFSQLMNDKAYKLGLQDTHFVNPHGLDAPDHYSTAKDLAVLAAYAMKNPIFAKTVSTKNVTIGQRQLKNHNKLLWMVDGADGVKTGFTKSAGRILVSSAIRDGRRLIAVTMNAPNDWNDHTSLLNFGFAQFKPKTIVKAAQVVGSIEVEGGNSSCVELIAAEDFLYAVMETENVEILLPSKEFVYAPVEMGQDAGYAYVSVNETVVGKIRIAYGQTIEIVREENTNWLKRLLKGEGL